MAAPTNWKGSNKNRRHAFGTCFTCEFVCYRVLWFSQSESEKVSCGPFRLPLLFANVAFPSDTTTLVTAEANGRPFDLTLDATGLLE